ncbi:MAG: type VII toxin-antitoxin system HepT family RNase toxin [Candidatus Hodarchaeales archaeon]
MALEDVILNRFSILDRYLGILKKIIATPEKQFLSDEILIGSAERYLQVAIECVLDTGNHIIAAERYGRAQTYSDIFTILKKSNVISSDLANRLIAMSRFRNRLVHVYFSISPEITYRILKNDLNDFQEYMDTIKTFLMKKKEKK